MMMLKIGDWIAYQEVATTAIVIGFVTKIKSQNIYVKVVHIIGTDEEKKEFKSNFYSYCYADAENGRKLVVEKPRFVLTKLFEDMR